MPVITLPANGVPTIQTSTLSSITAPYQNQTYTAIPLPPATSSIVEPMTVVSENTTYSATQPAEISTIPGSTPTQTLPAGYTSAGSSGTTQTELTTYITTVVQSSTVLLLQPTTMTANGEMYPVSSPTTMVVPGTTMSYLAGPMPPMPSMPYVPAGNEGGSGNGYGNGNGNGEGSGNNNENGNGNGNGNGTGNGTGNGESNGTSNGSSNHNGNTNSNTTGSAKPPKLPMSTGTGSGYGNGNGNTAASPTSKSPMQPLTAGAARGKAKAAHSNVAILAVIAGLAMV
ncbi:hypothetical protein B0A55_12405 [Friedmanniomyces simplex]|uniref:Uncharacterized protein n=1 Tax=Friedmanniomyces simplex TaxID=329884 RepID=A0A4V5NDG0_9PEZI|nr:hypothetical protein B0A55_12405 [Friedmanniomyces simplex]